MTLRLTKKFVTGALILVAVGIFGEDGSALDIVGRQDVPGLAVTRRAKHPIVISKQAEVSRGLAIVRERQQRELHRIVGVYEHLELVAHTSRRPREACDACRMMDHELSARGVTRDRPGCW